MINCLGVYIPNQELESSILRDLLKIKFIKAISWKQRESIL